MRRSTIIVLLLWFGALCMHAQLAVTQECKIKEGDLSTRKLNDEKPMIIDGDTIPFAIVRVGLVEPDATFESRWVRKQEKEGNEYILYVLGGCRSVVVKTKRFAPLHYRFPEPLEARNTYIMTIGRPQGEKYKGTLHITSNVPEADIYVDGEKVSDGTPFTYTGEAGIHRIELKADGFDPQTREIDIPMGQQTNVNINLFAAGSLSVDGVGYGMVPVEATSFTMGGPLNFYTAPLRKVSLRPFNAGSTLVSAELWDKVMGESGLKPKGTAGQVVDVSYDEIQDFISALNAKTGKEFRLPTEAEWEYMAKNASALGITDIGSTMEWCNDWFGKYSISDLTSPQGPAEGVMRSVRGGSEYTDGDPMYGATEYRWRKQPDKGSALISFRLVEDN